MNKITINPSIASIVNIEGINQAEKVPVYFTASENWAGDYALKVYNSEAKNSEITIAGNDTLTVVGSVMTLTVDAVEQSIAADSYYYEIISSTNKRVIFKGKLIINK